MPAERLQKLLAAAGHGSRRSAEALIVAGRVTVDGRVAALGERADLAMQRVALDGESIAPPPPERVVWALHKPLDVVVSASDELGRQTVYDLLANAPAGMRYVGRLDRDSTGLLLFTTDGELAHRLTHPRFEVTKTYEATVEGVPEPAALERLRRGVRLDDGVTAPASVDVLEGGPRARVRLVLREGRKREVRRMMSAVGHPVIELVRVAFGSVTLGNLEIGAVRPLDLSEEAELRTLVGLPMPAPDPIDATDEGSILFDTARARREPTISADSLARSIAIDGATASGKSVVGRAVAEHLGIGFVDTGLMYRACTLAVLEANVNPENAEAVIALVRSLDLDLVWPELASPHVTIAGEDVTARLRTPGIEHAVSLISRVEEVRDELVRMQRALADRSPIVMAGRDIGTRVLTEARTKIFLEASSEVRARRRLGEEQDSGRATTFERVLDETRRRDDLDSTGHRAIRREQAAPDALVIDTDLLGIDDVVERCLQAYAAANGA